MWHLPYWTAQRYSLVFRLLASGHQTFLIESTSFLKPAYCFTVKVFFLCSFNKRRQQRGGMLKLGFTEITEHKNIMTLNFKLQQSVYFRSIWRFIKNSAPKYSDLTGVQQLFPLCFFFLFVRNNKAASDWQSEAWWIRNNSKPQYFTWDFQLIFKHQLYFFKCKKP